MKQYLPSLDLRRVAPQELQTGQHRGAKNEESHSPSSNEQQEQLVQSIVSQPSSEHSKHIHASVQRKAATSSVPITVPHSKSSLLSKPSQAWVGNLTLSVRSQSPLHTAAARGDLDTIRQILTQGTQSVNDVENGSTALHYAACGGYVECCALLIHLGSDPFIPDASGQTALHLAADRGLTDIASGLVDEFGSTLASSTGATRSSWSPLFCAVSRGRLSVVQQFLGRSDRPDNLIHEVDAERNTLLHVCKSRSVTSLLLSLGCSTRALNASGRTAAEKLREDGCANIAELLDAHDDATSNGRSQAGHSRLIAATLVRLREGVKSSMLTLQLQRIRDEGELKRDGGGDSSDSSANQDDTVSEQGSDTSFVSSKSAVHIAKVKKDSLVCTDTAEQKLWKDVDVEFQNLKDYWQALKDNEVPSEFVPIEVVASSTRRFIHRVFLSPQWRLFVMSIVIISYVFHILSVSALGKQSPNLLEALGYVDTTILGFLSVEAVLFLFVYRERSFLDTSMIVNIVLVAMSWMVRGIPRIESLRILRIARITREIEGLGDVIRAVASSLPKISNLAVIMFLTWTVFATLAVEYYGVGLDGCDAWKRDICQNETAKIWIDKTQFNYSEWERENRGECTCNMRKVSCSNFSTSEILAKQCPGSSNISCALEVEYQSYPYFCDYGFFGSFSSAVYTLFIVGTLEGWLDFEESASLLYASARIYFIAFIALNTYIMLNMFVGLVVENVSARSNRKESERQLIMKKLEKKYKDVEEAFNAADVDNSGTLTIKELKKCLEKSGVRLSEKRLTTFFQSLDTSGDNAVSLIEFQHALFDSGVRAENMIRDLVEGTAELRENVKKLAAAVGERVHEK